MGLVYQLGHGGSSCRLPGDHTWIMTVLHGNGVHSVAVRFCECEQADDANRWRQTMRNAWWPTTIASPRTFATFEVLALFRRLNVTANVNVCDFVTTLEKLSNPLQAEWLPDRYKSMGMMTRQWSILQRYRRRGLGHLPGGVKTGGLGSAAMRCRACPRVGVNLPEGWRDEPENTK